MNQPNILVIDDEDMMFSLMKATLTPLGFNFHKGSNLSDFNQTIADLNIDVVILDYLMPKKNGMEVAQEIRNSRSDVPILFLTSKQLTTEETKSLMALDMNYMRKPFIPQALSAKLKEILTQSNANSL